MDVPRRWAGWAVHSCADSSGWAVLRQAAQDLLGSDGQLGHADAARIVDRVGDRPEHREQGTLPDFLRAKRSVGLETLDRGRVNLGYLVHRRDCLLYTSDAADDLLCVDLGG